MKNVIRVSQLKLKPDESEKKLKNMIIHTLKLPADAQIEWKIFKKSLDARHKPDIYYVYSVDVYNVIISGKNIALNDIIEGKITKKQKHKMQIKNASMACINEFDFPAKDVNYSLDSHKRPVIAGFGPAGIFAALKLAEAGLKPIVIERGEPVDERRKTVENFWNTGELDTESNVQFGEGGAGTFSDGKLNTMIKDTSGRIRCMLETFVEFGADPSILYINKPHIGTDVLGNVVSSIRKHIIELGGEIRFNCKITDILTIEENSYRAISGIKIKNVKNGEEYELACDNLCLAIGHSARDTFEMLEKRNINMTAKSFAVGLRLEHPQSFINYNAYGDSAYKMPAADYKVTYQTEAGRGVYSFCMCPGGFVVPAASGPRQIVVNGMSPSNRGSRWSNSGMVVEVRPEDLANDELRIMSEEPTVQQDGVADPRLSTLNSQLSMMYFQESLEYLCWQQGNMKQTAPAQRMADFTKKKLSYDLPESSYAPGLVSSPLHFWMPPFIANRLSKGFQQFGKYSHGFLTNEATMIGVETRTSSPVRIIRDKDTLQHVRLKGLFPCGEGAGYAGGIVSAGIDGERCAEAVGRLLL